MVNMTDCSNIYLFKDNEEEKLLSEEDEATFKRRDWENKTKGRLKLSGKLKLPKI